MNDDEDLKEEEDSEGDELLEGAEDFVRKARRGEKYPNDPEDRVEAEALQEEIVIKLQGGEEAFQEGEDDLARILRKKKIPLTASYLNAVLEGFTFGAMASQHKPNPEIAITVSQVSLRRLLRKAQKRIDDKMPEELK